MEIQIKKAVKAGNSSAVILPRAWLNKKIRVEIIRDSEDVILADSLEILKKHIPLSSIIAICLSGSYARGEEDESSDIDLLVITDNLDKEMIKEGMYNILVVSQELLYQKLERDLLPVGAMLLEGKPLLNQKYLKGIDINITKKNIKWHLDTTKDKLELVKGYIEELDKKNKKTAEDRVVYTLILRIRTLQIIKRMIDKKTYSKKEFINLIKKISGGKDVYERYIAVKEEQEEKEIVKVEQIRKLYNYLEKELEKVKKIVEKR